MSPSPNWTLQDNGSCDWVLKENDHQLSCRGACKLCSMESLRVQSCEPSVLITWCLGRPLGFALGGTASVRGGAAVVAQRLCRAAALETATLRELGHAVMVLGDIAANACCQPFCKLAIGSSPTAPQTHLLCVLRFKELYITTGQGRVGNRKLRYNVLEYPKVKSSKPPALHLNRHTWQHKAGKAKTGIRFITVLRALRVPNPNAKSQAKTCGL